MPEETLQRSLQVVQGADGRFVPQFIGDGFVAGETGREDLIDDTVGGPMGGAEAFFFPQGLGTVEETLNIVGNSGGEAGIAEENPLTLLILQLEAVAQADKVKLQNCLIIIPQPVAGDPPHFGGLAGIPDVKRQVFVQTVQGHPAQVAGGRLQAEEKFARFQAETIGLGGLVGDGGVIHRFPHFLTYRGIILKSALDFQHFFLQMDGILV